MNRSSEPLMVDLGPRSYPIHIGAGVLSTVGEDLAQRCRPTGVVVVTQRGPAASYAAQVARTLLSVGVRCAVVELPSGERHKTLRTFGVLCQELASARLDRRSLVVGVGGGVVGDLAGFAASCFMRGIAYANVPTTLLAQVDSSVGGKTGVNLGDAKNLVGTFHQPCAVFADPLTLRTLPARDLRAGMAEVIKHGTISDDQFLGRLVTDMPRLLRRDADALARAVRRSCEIKAGVVARDETESGLRAVLNFGHTFGHALESATEYRRYRHGEAVAIGMAAACRTGEAMGVTPPDVTARVLDALRSARLPICWPCDVDADTAISLMQADKKSHGGALRIVLVTRLGEARIFEGVSPSVVRAGLARAGEPGTG